MLSDKGKFTYSRSCVTLVSCRADLCSSPVSTEAKTASDKTHTLVKSGSKTILLSFFLWAAFEPFDRNKRQWFIKITYKYGNIRGIKLVSTQLNKNCNSLSNLDLFKVHACDYSLLSIGSFYKKGQ